MSDPTVKPIDRLHLEARLFLEWLQERQSRETPAAEIRQRLAALGGPGREFDYRQLWDELFQCLFDQWAAAVRQEISGNDLPSIVHAILEEPAEEPPAAKQALKQRIGSLREKIRQAGGEDEEFDSDLGEMDRSLSAYEEVLEQFGDDPRLDEILRRGMKQALAVKERDFAWFEALLERLRSEKGAGA